jgi:hypothetical protein
MQFSRINFLKNLKGEIKNIDSPVRALSLPENPLLAAI